MNVEKNTTSTSGTRKIPVKLDIAEDPYEDFGLGPKLSPPDPDVHHHPPFGSFQPSQRICERTTSQRSTTASTSSVIASSNSSSKKKRRDSNNNMSTAKTLPVNVSCIYDDVAPSTSDVIPSTGDVTVRPGSCESAGGSSETAVHSTRASHQLEHLDSEHVARPTDWRFSCTSPAVADGGPRTSTTTTTTTTDVDDIRQDDGIETPTSHYEKLVRSGERRSIDSIGYTALARRTRDSIMTELSYESIPRLTATRRHAAAPITDNNDDDNSRTLRSTAGDYLHPM